MRSTASFYDPGKGMHADAVILMHEKLSQKISVEKAAARYYSTSKHDILTTYFCSLITLLLRFF